MLASVAFLEALINEVYADASDETHDSTRIAALSAATQASMQHYIGTARRPPTTLEKYDEVIRSAGTAPLDHSRAPYQHAGSLIRLRNALIHFEPGVARRSRSNGIGA